VGEGSASRPGRSLPPGKIRYQLYRKLGGPQGRSGQVRKILPPTGIRSPAPSARSQSLDRLCYPAHQLQMRHFKLMGCDNNRLSWTPKRTSHMHPTFPQIQVNALQLSYVERFQNSYSIVSTKHVPIISTSASGERFWAFPCRIMATELTTHSHAIQRTQCSGRQEVLPSTGQDEKLSDFLSQLVQQEYAPVSSYFFHK
jgi:hypothetical protein